MINQQADHLYVARTIMDQQSQSSSLFRCQHHKESAKHKQRTILPPRDLSRTHFPPALPPRPQDCTHAERALPKSSHRRAAAAASRASHPREPLAAFTLWGVAVGLGLADMPMCICSSFVSSWYCCCLIRSLNKHLGHKHSSCTDVLCCP